MTIFPTAEDVSVYTTNFGQSLDENLDWKEDYVWNLDIFCKLNSEKEAESLKQQIIQDHEIVERLKELILDVPMMITYEEYCNMVSSILENKK